MTHLLTKIFAATVLCSFLAASALAATATEAMHACEPADIDEEIYGIVFPANQVAQIRLMSDGSTILSLNVYDENGKVVLSDVPRNQQVVQWTPPKAGLFVVKVGPTEHSVLLTNGICQAAETSVARLAVTSQGGEGL
jgi:hypothetical protein